MKHPADLMLHEAIDGLRASPDATARAIGCALHRRHGDDASRLADLVVSAVQEARRAPRMPAPDYEIAEIDLTPPDEPRDLRGKLAVVAIVGLFAAALATVAIPAQEPFEPGPGYDICTTDVC